MATAKINASCALSRIDMVRAVTIITGPRTSGPDAVAHRILQDGDVAGQPGDQRRGAEPIDVGKGKALHLLVFRPAQLVTEALAGQGGQTA